MTDGHRTSTIARPGGGRATTPSRGVGRVLLFDGELTGERDRVREFDDDELFEPMAGDGDDDGGSDGTDGFLRDFTSPIPRDKQIIARRRFRIIAGMFALLIFGAIAAALFVLPVKSWMKQRNDLATRTSELTTLDAANARLQAEVDRLLTDEGVMEAAREGIDYVPGGEKRVTALPAPGLSTQLPTGWPYNLIGSIIAIRQAEAADAAAAAAATATTAPPVATVGTAPVTTAAAAPTIPAG